MSQDDGTRNHANRGDHDRRAPAEAPRRPEATLRDGNLKAVIWRNAGERRDYFATTFTRSYRAEDGTLRDTNSFVGADLLRLSELARGAYEHTTARRRDAFADRRKATPDKGRSPEQRRGSERVR